MSVPVSVKSCLLGVSDITPATPVAKVERHCVIICGANAQRRVAFDIRVQALVKCYPYSMRYSIIRKSKNSQFSFDNFTNSCISLAEIGGGPMVFSRSSISGYSSIISL